MALPSSGNGTATDEAQPSRKGKIMLIFDYPSKKAMKECIGEPLRYEETSIFGPEYVPNGELVGCNRPHLTGHKREFFAKVTMKDGIISKVV